MLILKSYPVSSSVTPTEKSKSAGAQRSVVLKIPQIKCSLTNKQIKKMILLCHGIANKPLFQSYPQINCNIQ